MPTGKSGEFRAGNSLLAVIFTSYKVWRGGDKVSVRSFGQNYLIKIDNRILSLAASDKVLMKLLA
ncbi:MAG: hypothetical protein ACREP6_07580 [Candidatus Binataceae bacterium]